MILFSPPDSIGLERSSAGIKAARMAAGRKRPLLKELLTLGMEEENVKPLYIHHPVLVTGVETTAVLVRSLILPLTKQRQLEAALAFQAEPFLPYPVEQAFLAYQITLKRREQTELTLLAVRKEDVRAHVESWQNLHIEPEKVSCVPSALCRFGATYLSTQGAYLIVHIGWQATTCVLVREDKLLAAFGSPQGWEWLLKAQQTEGRVSLPRDQAEWQTTASQPSPLGDALNRLQQEILKMSYALAKELKGEKLAGIAVTGEAASWEGLSRMLVQRFPFPLLASGAGPDYSSQQLHAYAVPIGLALGALASPASTIEFRRGESGYPHPWQRAVRPLLTYMVSMCLLSGAFYFFGREYLLDQEVRIRQSYLHLLTGMNKSHEQFETAFLAKHPGTHAGFDEKTPVVEQMSRDELLPRLAFLQKEWLSTPDSFPLLPNIPRVSDVLGWLSQHPTVRFVDEEGGAHTRLQIENFHYAMVKRPQQGKKQEKYQVRIELEFSSPAPKWAREFHDALIAPNEWVDPKGEVKWSTNRGKYKTSFFLKDKTVYPSAS